MTNERDPYARGPDEQLSLDGASVPFYLIHLAALGVFFVPFRWGNVGAFLVAYCLGSFGIMAGYHRYFSHRSYKTGRVFQFVLAALGTLTSQKGVLWWSGHHRNHHKHSDTPEDIHSPRRGFLWSHAFWFLAPKYMETSPAQLKEFSAYPELRFLNSNWVLGPVVLCATMLALGGLPWLFWGGFLPIVAMWHATFTINSLAHVWGSRRYETSDTSRNNPFLAFITFGEGWHNNHHHYQSSARNGFFWWEFDVTYYVLKALSWVGVVWDLRTPPAWVLAGAAGPARAEVATDLTPAAARVYGTAVRAMPTVEFTRNLARHVACPTERVAGGTLGAVLEAYFARHPAVRAYVFDEQGRVRHHVTVFVDGTQSRDRARLDEAVGEGSVVAVMQALSGG